MQIYVKLSTTLRESVPGYDPAKGLYVALAEGSTVESLLSLLRIDAGQVKIVMVNGLHGQLESALADGDRVGLFPAVGGG